MCTSSGSKNCSKPRPSIRYVLDSTREHISIRLVPSKLKELEVQVSEPQHHGRKYLKFRNKTQIPLLSITCSIMQTLRAPPPITVIPAPNACCLTATIAHTDHTLPIEELIHHLFSHFPDRAISIDDPRKQDINTNDIRIQDLNPFCNTIRYFVSDIVIEGKSCLFLQPLAHTIRHKY